MTFTKIEVPHQLRGKINPVKNRILSFSPSVANGEQNEYNKDDFESLLSTNIGVGGFSKVYKVRNKVNKKVYAIKVISKKRIFERGLVEQIRLEVNIQYQLNHPNILKLYNHYEDDQNIYLILQYCCKG